MNRRSIVLHALIALSALAYAIARADEAAIISKEDLAARHPGLAVVDIHDSQLEGFYEVLEGDHISYVTKDGRFLFRGDVFNIETRENLTETRRAEHRQALLASADPAAEIIFAPKDVPTKYTVTVFTDVDCGYCRRFHREIAEVNALGIEVRYVAYPRTGPNTESWTKAEHVWCAPDRRAALTQAKLGSTPAEVACDSNAVTEQYELGERVGVQGTPAIYSETGVQLGGYVAPAELLAQLEKLSAAKTP